MPYAPMALASVTAGPAVSSSSAAGPAFPLPQTTDDCQDERVLRLRTELARQPTRTIAQDPGHTPD